MDRRSALVLLAVFGGGVFLAGLELMITAVALPSILADLVDVTGSSAWVELRKASWIINGYLLVYILVMPLAGRLSDLLGARRLFLGALAVFTLGSALAGAAQDLDQLIAARLVQAVGGGVLVPVGTAAAAHLFSGPARPRALGVIGALTFLGMAAGPFLGAAILASVSPEDALASAGIAGTPVAAILAPAWRYIFYVNVPIGICGLVLAWAAGAGWETPRRDGRLDLAGALLFGIALATGLIALTLIGSDQVAGTDLDPTLVTAGLALVAIVTSVVAVVRAARTEDPFLDVRLFRHVPFTAATIVSLLTGYAFATAIIGGAVFVDRVLYGGPDEQRVALGALAGATAVGALVSGFLVRAASYRVVTLIGLALSVAALIVMSRWTAAIETDRGGSRAGGLRAGLRIDRDPSFDGRDRGGGAGGLRRRIIGRDGREDDRDGCGPRGPDRVRLHDDRPPLEPGVCDRGRLSRVHPRRSARPAAARPARDRSARVVGVARSRIDHGRPVPRRWTRDDRGSAGRARHGHGAAASGPGPAGRRDAYAGRRWQARARPHPLSGRPGESGSP